MGRTGGVVANKELPRLIGLGHRAQVGKDMVGQYLSQFGYTRFAFADVLKEVALDIDPVVEFERRLRISDLWDQGQTWDELKQFEEVRRFLQHLGTAVRDNVDSGTWLRATMSRIDKHLKADERNKAVITDVRFPNEADAVIKRSGALWRIDRPGIPQLDHVSETALEEYEAWTEVLLNDVSPFYLMAQVTNLLYPVPDPRPSDEEE